MCARIFYFLLAALFVFVVVTVAAFVYLEWWQAILSSLVTFIALILAGKWLITSTFRQIGEMAREAMSAQTRVLRGATATVHSVKPTDPPNDIQTTANDPDENPLDQTDAAKLLATRQWYEVEVTIFPDPEVAKSTEFWQIHTLELISADRKSMTPLDTDQDEDEDTVELSELVVIRDGEPYDPNHGNVTGPQRIRFVAGVPRRVRAAQFQYGFERFGLIPFPTLLSGFRS